MYQYENVATMMQFQPATSTCTALTLLQQLDLFLQRVQHGVRAERVEVSASHVERTLLHHGVEVTISVQRKPGAKQIQC